MVDVSDMKRFCFPPEIKALRLIHLKEGPEKYYQVLLVKMEAQ